jgi:hypothetical protein
MAQVGVHNNVAVEVDIHHKATFCILDIKHGSTIKTQKEIVEIAALPLSQYI